MYLLNWASLVAQVVKNLPAMQETWVWSLGWEDPVEKGMATHSSILAWRIPWTEEPGGLQSMGSQRVIHSLVTNTFNLYLFIWLPQVRVVAWGIFVESFGISCCKTQILYLWPVGSVVTRGVSFSVAWSILVPWPGMEPHIPCIARQILNHWTTREVCRETVLSSLVTPSMIVGLANPLFNFFDPNFRYVLRWRMRVKLP